MGLILKAGKEDELSCSLGFLKVGLRILEQNQSNMSYVHHDRTYEQCRDFATCILNEDSFQS